MQASRRLGVLALLVIACSARAAAQELHGTVVDSASRRPLASAVLAFFDAAGTALGRHITNERGEYRVTVSAVAQRVRVLRLGYRARDVAIPPVGAGGTPLDIAMLAIPALLEPVSVQAAESCPRRSDGRAALALLEQARAGLLATIVAREANPATMKLLAFERVMDGNSDRIERQSVRVDSSTRRVKSYEAAGTAADFVRDGFSRDSAGSRFYFGPDADVLLNDGFSNGYCFRIQDPERASQNQVGLGFSAAERRKGRVDIDGALWIDTVARTLSDIEFRFVGVQRTFNTPEQSGRVSFREMPNGMVVVDRWVLRLASAHQDTSYERGTPIRTWYSVREVGGEVARAIWSDGRAWKARLGTLQLHVLTPQGTPATSVIVRLDETDYLASPDAKGDLEIPDLLPGPYGVVVMDTALAPAGIALGTSLKLYSQRDSTVRATLVTPPPHDFLKKYCVSVPARHWVAVTVVRSDGTHVSNAKWELGEDLGTSLEFVHATGTTGPNGDFGFCSAVARGKTMQMRVSEVSHTRQVVIVTIIGEVGAVKIELPQRSP